MSKSYVALRGALCAAGVGAQLLWGSTGFASKSRLPGRHGTRAHAHAAAASATESSFAALLALEAQEPPPTGDQVVLWARPSHHERPVRIVAAPRRGAEKLGEARGATALQVLPTRLPAGRGDCRQWLAAYPTGYVCASDVVLEPGYASTPPAQDSATAWQRYRYGLVTARSVDLRGAGRYLRSVLQRGDGVTVTREVDGQAQLFGQKWLARKDIELATPTTMTPLRLDSLPPQAQPAWIVPPAGEALAPAYLAGDKAGDKASGLTTLALLPRYSVVLIDSETPCAPGRVAIQLPEATRALLKAYPEAQAAHTLEVDATLLRRFTRAEPPPDLGPDEKWIDISLHEQVATAYAGRTPLFATLVSTGKGNTTPPGTFFIYRKYLTQTMANQRGAASQYDFREVPHAQFFNGRIGLHAVLWHDSLGHPVSHGCVNLSPAAAQEFFAFSGPPLPPGWHSVTGCAPPTPAPTPSTPGGPLLAENRPASESASALIGTRVVVRR